MIFIEELMKKPTKISIYHNNIVKRILILKIKTPEKTETKII